MAFSIGSIAKKIMNILIAIVKVVTPYFGNPNRSTGTPGELDEIAAYKLAPGPGPELMAPASILTILIKDLVKRDIIPQTLAEKIQKSQNVNEKELFTALHRAANRGTIADIENLLREGAILDCVDRDSNSIFGWAAMKGREEIVTYFLNLPPSDTIHKMLFAKNIEGQDGLHLAVTANHIDTVKKLIADKRYHSNLNEKDIYQRTPLDYAVSNKSNDLIRLLLGKSAAELTDDDIEKMPNYGIPFNDLSQTNLNGILGEYLTATKRKKDLVAIEANAPLQQIENLVKRSDDALAAALQYAESQVLKDSKIDSKAKRLEIISLIKNQITLNVKPNYVKSF